MVFAEANVIIQHSATPLKVSRFSSDYTASKTIATSASTFLDHKIFSTSMYIKFVLNNVSKFADFSVEWLKT